MEKILIRKNKVKDIFTLICISVIIYIFYAVSSNVNKGFYINLIMLLLILVKSKLSIFSIIGIIFFYPQISYFFQYNMNESYGVFQLMINTGQYNLYYEESQLYAFIFLWGVYSFLMLSNILELEKKMLKRKYYISNKAVNIISVIAISATIICFPNIPFTNWGTDNRFWTNALLPGTAWNHVALISIIILTVARFKDNIVAKGTVVVVVFIFLSNFERVDMLGYFLTIALYWTANNMDKISLKRIFLLAISVVLILFLNAFIGEFRQGIENISFLFLVKKVIIQNTATDIAYLYNSTIDYINMNPLRDTSFYYYNLLSIIPGLDSFFDVESVGSFINRLYRGPGGEFILIQPLIDFGYTSILPFVYAYMSILNFILKRKNDFFFLLYLFLSAGIYRIMWYGITYIETGMFFILPIIYIICFKTTKKISRIVKL